MGNQVAFDMVIATGETDQVEFKRCGAAPEADTFESVCAFANSFGGSIYLGVGDDGEVLGIARDNVVAIRRNITNVLHNPALFDEPPEVMVDELVHEGKVVLRIWVPMSPVIHRFKKTTYLREGDSDVQVRTASQLADLAIRKQCHFTEQRIFPYLTEGDLRMDLMGTFRRMALLKRPDHPWKAMSDREVLKASRLYAVDYATGAEGFNLAAALIMGRDDVIESVCPAYRTDALVRLEDTDRYDERLMVTTNLIEAHERLCSFVARFLPDRFALDRYQAIGARDVIVRELVANTLMHREYSSAIPATITIGPDALMTTNASRPSFLGRFDPLDTPPITKNPIIGRFFNHLGLAEELGSGSRTLVKLARGYSGSVPVFEEGSTFTVTFPLRPLPHPGDAGQQDTGRSRGGDACVDGTCVTGQGSYTDGTCVTGRESHTDGTRTIGSASRVDEGDRTAGKAVSTLQGIWDDAGDERIRIVSRMFEGQSVITVAEVSLATGLSTRSSQRLLAKCVEKGFLQAHGNTRSRTYTCA